MAELALRDVNKIYRSARDSVHAVEDLNLDIADGEFVALLGPSGCGKTSTLRMIVGLEDITSGEICFDRERVNDLEPQRRNVAMAFETYALYPNFTIEENLAFPLEVLGMEQSERTRKVGEIAELLHLTTILDQKPMNLSGGQQQRVSLGRALIRDPAIFILDEVMSHIDAHLKFQMLFDLKAIHRDLRKTMIYVTHDQMEALALADRVAVMSNAKLQQIGTRNELYNEPVNLFVADFIGEPPTNFFSATVEDVDGGPRLRCGETDFNFETTAARSAALRERGVKECIVGLRPQNLAIAAEDGRPRIEAQVRINEYLGERSILTLAAGAREFRALVPPETAAGHGETLRLSYRPEDIMVFDRDTEARIE